MKSDGHEFANKAFKRLLICQSTGADQKTLVGTWIALVKVIHRDFPQWVCSGPHPIACGKIAFTGTKNYVMIFDTDGEIYVGTMKNIRLMPDYRVDCAKLDPLVTFVKRFKK